MRAEYFPAIGPYVTDPGPWRHPIHWLDADTPVFYPRVLASYGVWRDDQFSVSREGVTILGDSGGYQMITQEGADFDPVDVLRWQIRNCSRGLILDVPPYEPGAAIQLLGRADEWFQDSLKWTVGNVERALPYFRRHAKNFSWWGVIQGQTVSQIKEWHGRIAEVYPFDGPDEGWALSAKPSTDLLTLARYTRFAHDHGLRRVHILQISGARQVGVVLGLAALSGDFDLVTYDTATALRAAVKRVAIVDEGLAFRYINEKSSEGETSVIDFLMACPCQACQWVREDYPLTNAEYPHYLILHNHLTLLTVLERVYQAALRDPDDLLRLAAGDLYGEVMREWDKEAVTA